MNPNQSGPEPVYSANTPPTPMPEPAPLAAPDASSPNITPTKKRGLPKALLAVVLLIVVAGVAAFVLLRNQPDILPTDEAPKAHFFEEFDYEGIPINESTISFVKADGKFCLLYNGIVYLPQDSGVYIPKSEEETAEMSEFPWIGLVDAPESMVLANPGEVFSFKDSPSNNSFVFIMRWSLPEGEEYRMYRFFNNNFSELRTFTSADGLYHIPKLNLFSLGGNFLNLSMFRCANCLDEQPETLLYYIPTGDTRNVGQVSFFEWGEDDNVYRYKAHQEGVDPDTVPLRTNEFFEQSEELLGT